MTDAVKETAKIVIPVSESTREFFKLTNFQDIPEDTAYVAFFEDGNAMFLTKENFQPMLTVPKFIMFHGYLNIEFEIEY